MTRGARNHEDRNEASSKGDASFTERQSAPRTSSGMATADLFAPGQRAYSDREEALHALSHGAAIPVLLVGAWLLIARAEGAREVAGAAAFGLSAVAVYLASTLYHASWRSTPWQRLFRMLDHAAIYLKIAGTYTPLALLALPWATGTALLAGIWGLAAAGIGVKLWRYHAPAHRTADWLSLAFYLAMGWCGLLVLAPLWHTLAPAQMGLLLGGGLAFTAGAGVYAMHWLPYTHLVWHLFVMAGTACHFALVWTLIAA